MRKIDELKFKKDKLEEKNIFPDLKSHNQKKGT